MTNANSKQPVVDGLLPVAAGNAFFELEYRHVGLAAGAVSGAGANAPVLVFLHEGLGCVTAWRDFPRQLCERVGLAGFVYSRPGYGRSSPARLPRTPRYLHDEALLTLPAVLDAAGIERAILVGHSDGASIALIFAGSRHASGRLDALALMAPHVFNEVQCIEGVLAAEQAYEQGPLREALRAHHGEQVEQAFGGWRDIWLHKRFRRWNIEACLGAIEVPTLVVQGDNDAYGTVSQLDSIEAGVRRCERAPLIGNCGHSPYREQPEVVLQLLDRFVRQTLGLPSTLATPLEGAPTSDD